MASYFPHYQKKRDILRRKEQALRRLIALGADLDVLLKRAAEVRDARVRMLEARRSAVPPRLDLYGNLLDKIAAKIIVAREVSAEKILEDLRSS